MLMYACKKGRGGDFWGEVGTVHLSGQRNRLKVWGLWCRILLVSYWGWVVNQDGVLYQNLLEIGSMQSKGGPGCWQL